MMDTLSIFSLVTLCGMAFCAGLIDSAVGGGGLIQIPALISVFPTTPEASLLGTNKLASVSGSSIAARHYFGKVHIPWGLVLPVTAAAFAMSFAGAAAVSHIPSDVLRPLILVLIVVMAVYIFWKKDFGSVQRPVKIGRREHVLSIVIGGAIGFYDGLLGPGAGSFLIFLFIRYFSFDFLQATASAKFVNIATNIAALVYFVPTGNVLYVIAVIMAAFNMLGAFTGSWVAMKYGAGFVRVLFLILLLFMIFKLSYLMFYTA